MIDLHKFLFSIILCCSLLESTAQKSSDTLQISRDYSEQNDYNRAISILKTYIETHVNDSDGVQLLGLNYYWNEQYNEADSFYKKQLDLHPGWSLLKLDYARMLFEQNNIKQSKPILENILLESPDNIEALEYLGYINYWWGNYKEALSHFNLILELYPTNTTALEMVEVIELVINPYFKSYHEYSYDSQPLQSGLSNIEAGKFHSRFFKPNMRASYLYFISDKVVQVPWFELSNEFSFFKNKTRFIAEIGVFNNVLSEPESSGMLELTQSITNKISLSISAKSRPYFYTLSSMEKRVSFNALNASVLITDPNRLNLMMSGEKQRFMDNNEISNAFLWVISPDFGWDALSFNLGYGYSYTDADSNMYKSVLSLDEILTDYQEGEIKGVYDPYFTPEDQHIHSLIGSVSLSIKRKLELVLKGNIGVYAYADIPYLYLDKDSQDNIYMNKGYSREEKVPFEISTTVNYYIKKRITLNASYVYIENFFYLNRVFDLRFKYVFN